MTSRRVILTLALGLLLEGSSPAARLPSPKDRWIRVETEHFTLFSDAGEGRTREIGLELERLQAVLSLFQKSAAAGSPVPTSVFVFKSDSAFEPYKPLYQGRPTNSAGFFEGASDGNRIALTASWNTDPRPVVYHEYLHYFLRSHFPPQPVWYDEGLADFYSTFQATATEARVGLPVDSHLRRLRNEKLLPLRQLFAVGVDSPEYNEGSRRGVFYAESWALVHYLMRGELRRTPQLGRFLVLLQQGRPQDDAFREAFGSDYGEIEKELSRYVRATSFAYRRVTFSELPLPRDVRTTAMSYEETLCRLGDLLGHGDPGHLPDAEAHFQAVLALHPADADALAGLGLLRMRQERFGEAQELLARSAVNGSRDFRVPFYRGELEMRAFANQMVAVGALDAAQRRVVEQARAAYRASLRLNPQFAQASAALGKTYLLEDGPSLADGVAALETAMAALPGRKDVALDLAELYDRRGEKARSDELLKRTLGAQAEAVLDARRKRREARSSLERVNALVGEGKEDEAVLLLERVVESAPPENRKALAEHLASLRAGVARNRSVRLYNEAVNSYNRRDLEAALAGFEKVAATAEDQELARSAREQAKWMRKLLADKSKRRPTPGRRG